MPVMENDSLTHEEIHMMAPAKKEFSDVEAVQAAQNPAELLQALYELWHRKIAEGTKGRNWDESYPVYFAHRELRSRIKQLSQ